MQRRDLPRYCSRFRDRHGKWRVTFRRYGATHYFKSCEGTDEFAQEYMRFLAGNSAQPDKPASRSIAALIAKYYRSAGYVQLAGATRRNYRGVLEGLRRDFGDGPVATLQRKHVKDLVNKRAATPTMANSLLAMLRLLMRFAIDEEWRKDDPTQGLKAIKIKFDGYVTWSEADRAAFEVRFALGTRARLALALLYYTAQRREDVIIMGWQHIKNGRITITQRKTGARVEIFIHPELEAVLQATPREQLTFITTEARSAFTPGGFSNWFKQCCREAGLNKLSAHGLRKGMATDLAEDGCTPHQIMAVTGHKTLKEVTRYTEAANLRRLADGAIKGREREQKLSNQRQG